MRQVRPSRRTGRATPYVAFVALAAVATTRARPLRHGAISVSASYW